MIQKQDKNALTALFVPSLVPCALNRAINKYNLINLSIETKHYGKFRKKDL